MKYFIKQLGGVYYFYNYFNLIITLFIDLSIGEQKISFMAQYAENISLYYNASIAIKISRTKNIH